MQAMLETQGLIGTLDPATWTRRKAIAYAAFVPVSTTRGMMVCESIKVRVIDARVKPWRMQNICLPITL